MKPTEEKIQGNASDLPVYLFKQGNNCEAYRYFGAHLETHTLRQLFFSSGKSETFHFKFIYIF